MRFLGKFFLLVGIFLFIAWAGVSIALNNRIKDRLEAGLSKQMGQPVTIGHLRAGWDPLHPAVAALDVKLGEEKRPVGEASKVELGIFLKNIHPHMDIVHEPLYAAASGIRIGGKPYGDYEAELALPQGMHFTVSKIKGDFRGAKVTGEASEDLKYRWKADLQADNLDYSVLSEDVKGGKARVSLRLSGIDESQRDIIRHLSGRATLVGGEGKLEGRALNFWAGSLLTAFLPGNGDTHLNCTVADFHILNGIARSRTVIIDTNKATITGKGTVDLIRQRVDMVFTPRTKGLGAVVSLATPVVVSGNFSDITTHPQAEGMAKKMGGFLLDAIAPPMALLPLLTSEEGNPCEKFLEHKGK
jgi:uncharacterized protein involved in outer membrane biogenesis